VTFLNEKSGEYQFYELTLRSVKPSALGLISLATAVRMLKQHSLTVDNPLPTAATLTCTSTVADIIIPPQLVVQPESFVCIKASSHQRRDSTQLNSTVVTVGIDVKNIDLQIKNIQTCFFKLL